MIKKLLMFIIALTFVSSCAATNSNPLAQILVDTNTLKLGVTQNGVFSERADKVYKPGEKIDFKILAKNLTVINSKVKVNIDLFLKKDTQILGIDNNILGKDGLSADVTGVPSNYSGNNGQVNITTTINPPSGYTGDFTANITVKDLNSSGQTAGFEAQFSIKN